MEVIAFLTLAAAGYIINRRRATSEPLDSRYLLPHLTPTLDQEDDDLYETRRCEQVRMVEYNAATDAYRKSLFPEQGGVIPRNFTDDTVQQGIAQRRRAQDTQPGISSLSGLPCDYSHTNAVPFFGGRVKQQTLDKGAFTPNQNFELFTGTTATGNTPPTAKRESSPLFEPTIGNVYGAQVGNLEDRLDRLQVGRLRQNERPFEQMTVGPAINGGYNGDTNDSYLAGREYQMPRDTDEVRNADNPKITYEGRTIIGGERVGARGLLGEVREQSYPERYKETFDSSDWMKTTGANLGEASRPEEVLKDVTRHCTHVEYIGSAGPTSATNASYTGQGIASETRREGSSRLPLGPASAYLAADRAAPLRADYGRANILVYANERDTTNVSAFAGSLSTVVKSIIAPLFDMMRPARRQVLGTDAPRAFGNVGATIPAAQTIRDPDGVLRTTIRETITQFTENPGAQGSMKGPALLPVYDPSDVARTTIRETTTQFKENPGAQGSLKGPSFLPMYDPTDVAKTTIRETTTQFTENPGALGSLKGPVLLPAYDPADVSRTTIRETTMQIVDDPGALGSFKGPVLLPVYDASDVARTTMKEQTIHDGTGVSYTAPAPSTRRTVTRDPNAITRTTIRETLDMMSTAVNPTVPSRGLLLRDPDLNARTTVKESTVSVENPETSGTAVGRLQGGRGGYTSADMTPFQTTIRQFTQDDNRFGAVGTALLSAADGYRVSDEASVPRETQKQVLSDNSYYGSGRQQGGGDAPTSHEEYVNSTFRPEKEMIAVTGRGDFGLAGVQHIVGRDDVDVRDLRKSVLDVGMEMYAPSIGRVQQHPVDATFQGVPEVKNANTCSMNAGETRSSRGTYSEETAIPSARFDEDVRALTAQRAGNPTVTPSFFINK